MAAMDKALRATMMVVAVMMAMAFVIGVAMSHR
jgi:hypothetical protein